MPAAAHYWSVISSVPNYRKQITAPFHARTGSAPLATPFVHAIVQTRSKARNGTLEVTRSPDSTMRLLCEAGRVVAACGRSELLSRHQLISLVVEYCGLAGCNLSWHDEVDLVSFARHVLRGDVDPLMAIAEAARKDPCAKMADASFSSADPTILRLADDFSLSPYDFNLEERLVIGVLSRGATTATALTSRAGVDARLVRRVLYVLRLTGGLKSNQQQPQVEVLGGRPSPLALRGGDEAHAPPRRPTTRPQYSGAFAMPKPPPQLSRPTPPRSEAGSYRLSGVSVDKIEIEGTRQALSTPPVGHGPSSIPPARTSGVAPRLPAPPSTLPERLVRRWEHLIERYRSLDLETHFQLLRVSRAASEAEMTQAYFHQVDRWSPDNLPTELAPLRPYAESIVARLAEAFAVVRDPAARAAYIHELATRDDRQAR